MRNTYMVATTKVMAKAIGRNLPISPKASLELANFLRGKTADKVVFILKEIIVKRQAVPYKKFTNGPGHKPGMAAGRYPVKAAKEFLKLIENAKANASNQGITGTLVVKHIAMNHASEPFRQRAKERNTFKRCHVEVVLVEQGSAKADVKVKETKANKKEDKAADKSETE